MSISFANPPRLMPAPTTAIRVLHVYKTYYPDTTGGVEMVLQQLMRALGSMGVENRLLVLSPDATRCLCQCWASFADNWAGQTLCITSFLGHLVICCTYCTENVNPVSCPTSPILFGRKTSCACIVR